MSAWLKPAAVRLAIALLIVTIPVVGLAVVAPTAHEAIAHTKIKLVSVSGTGKSCPANVLNCSVSWTHINYWTHYTARIPAHCTIMLLDLCGIVITSRSSTSSCRSSNNCGHGPHSSTPKSLGPGSWTIWKGHRNINYRWRGTKGVKVFHLHLPTATSTPKPQTKPVPQPTSTPTPTSPSVVLPPSPKPSPKPKPPKIDWKTFNPCANGRCVPSCLADTIPNNCPWEKRPKNPHVVNPPNTPHTPKAPIKVCTTSWNSSKTQNLQQALRWESIVPYQSTLTSPHHPEVPGGRQFLTAASSPSKVARHWVALRSGANLNIVDASSNGCLWQATHVGVSLRELLPHQYPDLRKLQNPGNVAAAAYAQQAASLWLSLSPQHKQWYRNAFSRNDPATVWCKPNSLPNWTQPSLKTLSLDSRWTAKHDRCRWFIPRQGFWKWQLLIKYTSEKGDTYTHVVDEDLSWFREADGYLTQQVTLW